MNEHGKDANGQPDGLQHIENDKGGVRLDVARLRDDPRSQEPLTMQDFAEAISILAFRTRNSRLCPACCGQIEMGVPQAILAHEQMERMATARRAAAEAAELAAAQGKTKH